MQKKTNPKQINNYLCTTNCESGCSFPHVVVQGCNIQWYKAATFSLTQVFAVEVIICKMQRKGTSPEGKPTINE